MKTNYTIGLISGYKISISSIRIILGFLIILFNGNLKSLAMFFFNNKIRDNNLFFIYLYDHINYASLTMGIFLALVLIFFSVLEILFSICLFYKRKTGVIGLFIISLLWIPIEILFISRFLFVHKLTTLIIDFAIIMVLFRIIMNFRKHKNHPYEL